MQRDWWRQLVIPAQAGIQVFIFLFTCLGPLPSQAQEFSLPAPGSVVSLSPAFNPPILKGLKVHPDNPFRFEFILDKGDSNVIPAKAGIQKLIKYFLASLTIPEKDLWVNLSPYEKNRIVPEGFGRTEMGRDLLAEDYMLKQITASLIYPEGDTGKKFWKKVYAEAARRFGTTNVPINTFNKVWILPEKAVVYENAKAGTAYVVEAKLKVMLEQDYLSLQKHAAARVLASGFPALGHPSISALGSEIIREIVLPELTKEINSGRNFAQLRQVYNSLILAAWYKKKIKDSILAQVYENKNKVQGLVIPAQAGIQVETIYQRYLQAFKKGAYNYIKEEIDPTTRQSVPRKYFSGGLTMDMAILAETTKPPEDIDRAQQASLEVTADFLKITPDRAMAPAVPSTAAGKNALRPKFDISKADEHYLSASRTIEDMSSSFGQYVDYVRGPDGAEFYIKTGNEQDRVNEYLVYLAALKIGVHVPAMKLIRVSDADVLRSLDGPSEQWTKNIQGGLNTVPLLIKQSAQEYSSLPGTKYAGIEEAITLSYLTNFRDVYLTAGVNSYKNKNKEYVLYDLDINNEKMDILNDYWDVFPKVDVDKFVFLISLCESLDLSAFSRDIKEDFMGPAGRMLAFMRYRQKHMRAWLIVELKNILKKTFPPGSVESRIKRRYSAKIRQLIEKLEMNPPSASDQVETFLGMSELEKHRFMRQQSPEYLHELADALYERETQMFATAPDNGWAEEHTEHMKQLREARALVMRAIERYPRREGASDNFRNFSDSAMADTLREVSGHIRDNGLLDQSIVEYDLQLREHVNPEGGDFTVAVGFPGADVTNVWLTTGFTKAYWIYSLIEKEMAKEKFQEAINDWDNLNMEHRYFINKRRYGYGLYRWTNVDTARHLVTELKFMGATQVHFNDASGAQELFFLLPGDSTFRSIEFVNELITEVSQEFSARMRGQLDAYYEKGAEQWIKSPSRLKTFVGWLKSRRFLIVSPYDDSNIFYNLSKILLPEGMMNINSARRAPIEDEGTFYGRGMDIWQRDDAMAAKPNAAMSADDIYDFEKGQVKVRVLEAFLKKVNPHAVIIGGTRYLRSGSRPDIDVFLNGVNYPNHHERERFIESLARLLNQLKGAKAKILKADYFEKETQARPGPLEITLTSKNGDAPRTIKIDIVFDGIPLASMVKRLLYAPPDNPELSVKLYFRAEYYAGDREIYNKMLNLYNSLGLERFFKSDEFQQREQVLVFTLLFMPPEKVEAMVRDRLKQSAADAAMESGKGGIDLSKVKVDSGNDKGIQFHIDPAMLQQLENAPGFVPIIIDIQPMTNLRSWLGMNSP